MSKPASTTRSGFWKIILLLIILGAAALMISPVSADTGSVAGTGSGGTVTITKPVQVKYHIWEDSVTFSGTNTGSGTTYLFITGPNLKTKGSEIQSTHPGDSPVMDGDASTFQAARVGPDTTWSYTWDTHNVMIDSGVYTVYAASTPRDLPHINSTHFDQISLIMVPPGSVGRPSDTGTPDGNNASSGTGVTIAAPGDKSYYLGEEVVFSGRNDDSDTTYLFMTGPGTFTTGPGIPTGGGKLTAPLQAVVSGNPGSFDTVKTKPDKTWEYALYTANLPVEAGSYTVYATGRPEMKNTTGPGTANVAIILKKPFITAAIAPVSVAKGEPFTVTGTAEGNPPSVQIWIIGDNYALNTTTPVNADASFTFTGDTQFSGLLPEGPCYLIVQHSMMNNLFDIAAGGDYVRSLQGNDSSILFRIHGAGSLQGRDAADALTAAFAEPGIGDDTYTEIPFQVTAAEIPATPVPAAATAPVQPPAQPALLPFALIGAVVLVLGIVVWKRQ